MTMMKVAIFNFKGGTGKTTTVLNLGDALATAKRRVLLVDLDGQRTLSYGLRCDGEAPTSFDLLQGQAVQPMATVNPALSLIPGDLGLFQLTADRDLFTPALTPYADDYAIALLDCPPSLGMVSSQALMTSDRILIPILGEPAALKGLSEAVQLIRNERPNVPVDVVRCRYRSHLVIAKQANEILEEGSQELGYRLMKTIIPENVAVAEAIAPQLPVFHYAPKSSGTKAYQQLARECLKVWYE